MPFNRQLAKCVLEWGLTNFFLKSQIVFLALWAERQDRGYYVGTILELFSA